MLLLLSPLDFSWAKWAGYAAAICASLAAVMDLIEGRGMLRAIAGEATDGLANSIRYPSLVKWRVLFLFSLLVLMQFALASHSHRRFSAVTLGA